MLWEKPNINTFCLAGREGLLKRETFLSGSFLRHCRLTVSECFHCLVIAWTVYPLHLTPALAFSGLVRGVRWWHLVKERSWDLDLGGKACCAELLMASGVVGPSSWSLQGVKAPCTMEAGRVFFCSWVQYMSAEQIGKAWAATAHTEPIL